MSRDPDYRGRSYEENLKDSLVWKRELFTNPRDYNRMIGAIRLQRCEWQYFKGLAFTDPYFASHAHDQILKEAKMAMGEIKQIISENMDLGTKLDNLILEYEEKEEILFDQIKAGFTQSGIVSSVSYGRRMSVQQKINSWTELINGPLLRAIAAYENNGQAANLTGEQILYCFLMSKELYDEIKNTPLIRTRLSRKDWERRYTGKSEKYDKGEDSPDFIKLEEEFAKAFYQRKGSKMGMSTAILEAFEMAFNDISVFGDERTQYLTTINNSYRGLVKKTNGITDYKIIHDNLKKWGIQIFKQINEEILKKNEKAGRKLDTQLKEIKVGDEKITFFLISNKGGSSEEGDDIDLSVGLYTVILERLRKRSKSGSISQLSVQGIGKVSFTPKVFEEAEKIWSEENIQRISMTVNNFLKKRENKKWNSNSAISGILGELALLYSIGVPTSLKTELTGGSQQRYRYGQNKMKEISEDEWTGRYIPSDDAFRGNLGKPYKQMSEKEKSRIRDPKAYEKWRKSYKGTGEFFSDATVSADGIESLTGINVKRYISNENTFDLIKGQGQGLDLKHHILRRYLSEKEIILLSYLQENYEIFEDSQDAFPITFPNIKEAGKAIMNKNITNILRISGASFDIVNYLFFANGKWIPASAILLYAKNRFITQQRQIFEILNDQPMPYYSLEYKPSLNEDGTRQIVPANRSKLDISQLRYIERVKQAQSLTFRFKTFTVNIKNLLSL